VVVIDGDDHSNFGYLTPCATSFLILIYKAFRNQQN
jgi:hypothetical protein